MNQCFLSLTAWGLLLALAPAGAALSQTATSTSTVDARATTNSFVAGDSSGQPAVSAINGKVDYAGGLMNSAEGHNFSGSLTLPIGRPLGFQADALYSHIGDRNFYGGAGHFFWRQPDHGLLGLAGGYLYRDGFEDIYTFHAGLEGQLYYRQFTFGFFAGAGHIDYQYGAPFIATEPTRFIGRVSVDYYPLRDLRLGGSFTTALQDKLGKIQAEWQTPIHGVALTAEGAWGDYGYHHWLLGVRYYFGGNKSLRERQRQDDPPNLMPEILDDLGVYGSEFNQKMNNYIAANPGISSSSGGSSTGGGNYGVESSRFVNQTMPVEHGPRSSVGDYDAGVIRPQPPTSLSPSGSDSGRTMP